MSVLTNGKQALFFRRIRWRELLAILFILLGIYFFRRERHELQSLSSLITNANHTWLLIGVGVTGLYLLLQAAFFLFCFRAVHSNLSLITAIVLFLKQNFISIFLPGGGVTSFAYLPSLLRKENIERYKIYQAAALQGFVGIFTVLLVGFPVISYALLNHKVIEGVNFLFAGVFLLISIPVSLFIYLKKKRNPPQFMTKAFTESGLRKLLSFDLSKIQFFKAIFLSVCIELEGVIHLNIAMRVVGADPSWEAAFTGYIVSTLFLIISPFLKGLGAVELSLAYILQLYGFNPDRAVEIALIYRLLEFWLPLGAGIIVWTWKGKNLFLRLAPSLLIFILGVVNIFSALIHPTGSKPSLLKEYIPLELIHASNWLVIMLGLVLLVTATFLIRGLKGAWWLALCLSVLSLIGHLVKSPDYKEVVLAIAVITILLISRKQYRLKSDPRYVNLGFITALGALIMVLIFGTLGFYLLDKKHFGVDFSLMESVRYAISNFLLIQGTNQLPITHFGKEFIIAIRVLGITVWSFLLFTLFRPFLFKASSSDQQHEKALFLTDQYGSSAVDYYKTDTDKLLFFSAKNEGFLAYKVANGFAIVLEEPVCDENDKVSFLMEFDLFCINSGLKPAYYRVDEDSLYHFSTLNKRKLLIGQEGVTDIENFTLEGKQNKALRNALNSLTKKEYQVQVHKAPHSISFVSELKKVSDEWLSGKSEIIFSQGMFNFAAIRNQDVIALHDSNETIVAFLNIIPDYAPDECTYDLIRKTVDAPAGCMDALIIKLIEYAKTKDLKFLNLGLVPMSGISQPESTAERVVKYAYERIRRFRHYQGLREFKEKYASQWVNKYLVYDNDFDLIQLPNALRKVMEPKKKGYTITESF
ncbi:phosphatidylglycerol lysyltransferase domain-containing protein [Solitalea sp. MAHUQ-68]|uniref:Phosphatidylglycerol lysyltransferase n=1 Tax=Solitalea agri TaxID=2953739 RepID=A0A9X2EZI5_9SPHI|nr:phosphatidylglycerol lysyltransferase domain-containing protein [Solitalea agri]MCO4291932.1 phosphatidylglycerol lysyltransferase domain-containing protein [Solitalea agri]